MSPVLQQIHEIYKLVLHRDGKQVKNRSNLPADHKNVNAIISRWLGSNPSSINFSRNTVSLTEQICANQTPITGFSLELMKIKESPEYERHLPFPSVKLFK